MAVSFIGMAAVDKRLDHANHLVDMLRRARLDVRWQHAERGHVVVVGLDVLRRDLVDRLAGLDRRRVDLVVDVRDIARKSELVAPPQSPHQQVEYDRGPGIADVGIVVNRGPAKVHRHHPVLEGFERHLFALSRIV